MKGGGADNRWRCRGEVEVELQVRWRCRARVEGAKER